MKGDNVGNNIVQDDSVGGTVYIRINIPELKVQKCLQFQLGDSVWQAKQRILATFAKDLKDGLNYGLYLPPSNGRAGKFLDEERFLKEYPLQGPIGFLEFKYKRRVYKLLQINQRKIKQLHTKANLKQFLDYVRSGSVDKITKYTNKGLDPNYHDPETGETPLTVSATLDKDKVKDVVVSLVSGGAHLDFRNRLGLTSLHKAAIRGNVEALRTLLDLGAAPNYKDGRGLTPLYYSVANDTDAMCSELLLHDRAIIGTPDEQGWYEIHHACRHGRVQHLELLIFYGADMDVQNASGNTPLHVAAVNNQESCARVLLFRGATKEIFNFSNQVPYQVAIIAGNFELAEVIKNHKMEEVVPFREVPSYSSRRKSSTVTPSMRAVMRCRSDPRLNILTWEKGSHEQSTPDDSQSNISWKGYNSDSPRMSISSSSSSGHVISVGDQGYWEGRIGNQEGWFPSNHVNEVQMRPRSGSLGDIGDTVAVDRNTLAALVESREGPRTVVLQKGSDGYGFILRGAKSKNVPVSSLDFHPTSEYPALQYLESVDAGSMAEKAGLKRGDFILEINGHNVVQASHERVVELIKASGDTLQLRIITVRPQEKNWFIHQDGCMTLPTRGKGKAPQPPKRDPNTSLSYSKGRSKSFAEGLAEIEKLDQTLAQYDSSSSKSMTGLDKVGMGDESKVASIRARHAAKRVSCIQLDGEYTDSNKPQDKKPTPPVPPKKYASPSELRIQRYHKKYQQGTLEKARSTPNLANNLEVGKEAIYATPMVQGGNGQLVKNNRQFSSNGYKTVLSIGSGDSDSSTSSDSVTGMRSAMRQNIYSIPQSAPKVTSLRAASHSRSGSDISQGINTGNNIRSSPHQPQKNQPSPGVVIPPPPRKPAPQPPTKSEVVKISTTGGIYANVSADIQAKKVKEESPYESSFRPGTNAKVTKDPEVTPASVEQAKLRHQRIGSISSLQHAQQQMSPEDRQKFLSFPRHGHTQLELGKTSPGSDGPRTVSFAADRVFENAASFMQRHPNASLLVTAEMSTSERNERGRLSKELYEPEPDYDADSDDGDVVIPSQTPQRSPPELSRRSSASSGSSASKASDVHISTQMRSTGSPSGQDANTSVTVISVGSESPKHAKTSKMGYDETPHYSVNSNIPKYAPESVEKQSIKPQDSSLDDVKQNRSSPDSANILSNQIKMAAMARDKRREELASKSAQAQNTAPPPAPKPAASPVPAEPPTPPPPPPPPASDTPPVSTSPSQEGTVPNRPSAADIQSAVLERQNRIQNGEMNMNMSVGGEPIKKKPIDHTQAAILAAVAKRRSVLEQTSDKDIVNQIESRLNKTKKLQSVKYYGSNSPAQKPADVKPITATPKSPVSSTKSEPLKTAPKPQNHPTQNGTSHATSITSMSSKASETQKSKTDSSSDFLALAEKARQEYLQKKNSESPKKEVEKTPPVKKTPPAPLTKPQQVNNKTKESTDENDVSIRDKIKSFEKKLDLSSVLRNRNSGYEVRGVTMDHSHTEGESVRSNGQHSKEDLPPPMMAPPPAFSDSSEPVSDDVVQIEIIPPPSTFAGQEHHVHSESGGNHAFNHDDSVSLHSSVSTLSTLSSEQGEVTYSGRQITSLDEVIAPPPPGFSDNVNNYNDNYEQSTGFIPPPPEFQGLPENNSSKSLNKPFSSKVVEAWNCVDVLDWLESLNMLQYRSSFAKQCIDGKRLVELNRNDYIELGVTQVGHRMNIERSIKKLALQKSAVY